MKVRARIATIADLCLGAMYADRRFDEQERTALRTLLCELTLRPILPYEIEQRIEHFSAERFDLAKAAADFERDPPMHPRRLLELIAQLCMADGELDLDEDDYIRRLARALHLEPAEYEDIVLDYEFMELAESV